MFNTYKYIAVIGMLCSSIALFAQQDDHGWRVGGSIGYLGYHGDLSTNKFLKEALSQFGYEKDREFTYGVSLERKLTPGISLGFNASKGSFIANDLDRDKTDSLFLRSLNAKTDIRDINGSLIFKADNDKLLGKKFFLAPYFFVGGGLTDFKVAGNLRDANNNFYNYAGGSVTQDDTYETDLTNIGTESSANYATIVPHVNTGVGLRLRLCHWLGIHFQTDLRYTFSDHLDDISTDGYRDSYSNETQAFAAQPNPNYTGTRASNDNKFGWLNNDFYAYTSVGLRVSFGRKKHEFIPPVFYASSDVSPSKTKDVVRTDIPVGNGFVTIYDTLNVSINNYKANVDSSAAIRTRVVIDSLNQVKMNNEQIKAELAKSKAEYEALQAQMAQQKSEAQHAEVVTKLNEVEKDVKYLSIVAANNAKNDTTNKSNAQLDELRRLRDELSAYKAEQADKERQAIAQQNMVNQPQPNVVVTGNDAASMYYQSTRSEIQALRDQVNTLTNLLMSQQERPANSPVVVNNGSGGMNNSDSQAILNTLQALGTQLNSISTRLSALEGRQPSQIISPAPAPIINNVPVPQPTNNNSNNNNDQLLLNQLRQMQDQLNALNNKVNSQPTTAPAPVIVNTPAPTNNNNQELLNQIRQLQDQVRSLENKPAPAQQPIIVQTPAPQPVIVNTPAPKITYAEAIAPMRNISIYFDNNSSVISAAELTKIEKMARVLRDYPEAQITISGYTDATGSDEYNRKLSEKRANAVRDRLINGYSVQANKVVINAFGKKAASGSSNALDRRVDIEWVR
jgi:outer membrane protein OmpA-like peptidoglycan-associated protein